MTTNNTENAGGVTQAVDVAALAMAELSPVEQEAVIIAALRRITGLATLSTKEVER